MNSSSSQPVSSQLSGTGLPLEIILNNIEAIIYAVDIETYQLLYINAYARKYFNPAEKKICWQAFYPQQKGPCSFCTNDKLLDKEGHPGPPCQWEFKSPIDGAVFSVHDQAIIWNDGRIVKLTMATDISETKQTETELYNTVAAAKQEWEEIFNIINDAITIHDSEFNIIRANRTAEDILGLDINNILNFKCYESYHGTLCPPQNCPSCVSFKSGRPTITKMYEPNLKKHLEIKALPRRNKNNEIIGLVHVVRDITAQEQAKTEQKTLQKQLARSQKLEAIGQLAGGVAHDFNNLLTGILGFTGLAIEQVAEDDPLHEDLHEVEVLAKRAADLTRQLLTFSQRQPSEPIELNLNDIIKNLAKMLNRLLGQDVELILNLAKGPLSIIADPGQIEQIIANLTVNSRQAMPNGGTLTIQSRLSKLTGKESFFAESEVTAGEYALLEVIDTGCGMDNSVCEQIFDPFFTTKDIGQGSGLGMSMVYGIVQKHHGYIKVFSEPDVGTTVSVLLPLATNEGPEKYHSAPFSEKISKTKTILLVDDDAHILRLLKKILIKLGYKVHSADNYKLAESLMRQYLEEIDLALLDVIMPHKSGKELFDNLKILAPELKVIFISGHSGDSEFIKQIMKSDYTFLEKPISFTKLAETLNKVLEQ